MSDLAFGLDVARGQLSSFGQEILARTSALEVSTAALFVSALVLDRALERRVRASLRMALYAPIALRVLMPESWSLHVEGAPRLAAIVAPIMHIGVSQASDPGVSAWSPAHVLIAALYVGVALVLVARTIAARVGLGRRLAETTPVPGDRLVARAPCPIVQHDDLGPMAFGIFAPRIVLPRRLLAPGQEDALACVLRHEIAHLRRRDTWLSGAMQFLAVIAWPVVPLWLAMARVRQLIELACDEAALADADAGERRRYGHTLLDMAEWRQLTVAPLGAGELRFGSILRARIEALGAQRHWPFALQAIALSFAPVALLVACSSTASVPGTATSASTAAEDKGYGYEFDTESARAAAAAAPADTNRPPNAEGRMAPETIQAVVHQNFGAMRRCYDVGRAKNPALAGRVTVEYSFGDDGTTFEAADHASTMPDKDVVTCVVAAFKALTYPRGSGGTVAVIYPIEFTPTP